MHFDFTDLRLYLNILDSGNITAGAARSHLSLAAASARIRAMESSLGIDFLERGRRGVTPRRPRSRKSMPSDVSIARMRALAAASDR